MTTALAAETRIYPAARLLAGRLADDPRTPSAETAELDLLAVEQLRLSAAVAVLIARMGAEGEDLDALTERIAALLSQAEEVRTARARAAARRSGDESRWRDYLDLD